MLLTFEEYDDSGFSNVGSSDFTRYETEARYYLEYTTLNKVNRDHPKWIQDKIKYAMCRVIDLLYDYQTKLQTIKESDAAIIVSGLKSESIKSHSVSFRDATADSQSELLKGTESIIYATIKRILMPTGLLYRGL